MGDAIFKTKDRLTMTSTLLLLPGDGIGPEVTAQSRKLAEHLRNDHSFDVDIAEAQFGGASYDAAALPITDEVVALAKASTAVLMGAVGGPQWAALPYHLRPEAGLLRLRSEMGVFANLRPALCFPALADASSLKREIVSGLDIMFVRELIGGVYFGQPRGIETLTDGSRRGINTHSYTTLEIRRVAHTAFQLARTRTNRVCSVEKANVMEAGLLWREEVTALGASDYPDVELSHMYADNCAMQLVRTPRQFDVILTDNLFGDILSDAAAMLTGSLGMLPSAALGAAGSPGLYEPIHGSAPDIAGKGVANPCASILSLAMALRLSFDRPDLATLVERAVSSALDRGYRTRDLDTADGSIGTAAMGDAILDCLGA